MTLNPFASSVSVEWATPAATFTALAREFGPFDLDPAATAENAKAPLFYTEADDGLAQPWKGRVWVNPPYGREMPRWMVKAREAGAAGATVVCLVPARVDTRWWRDTVAVASLVRFFPQRLRFGDGADSAPFPSALIVLGPLRGRHGTTARKCVTCRGWFFPAYRSRKTCGERCRKADYRGRMSPIRAQNRDALWPAATMHVAPSKQNGRSAKPVPGRRSCGVRSRKPVCLPVRSRSTWRWSRPGDIRHSVSYRTCAARWQPGRSPGPSTT